MARPDLIPHYVRRMAAAGCSADAFARRHELTPAEVREILLARAVRGGLSTKVRELHAAGRSAEAIAEALTLDPAKVARFLGSRLELPPSKTPEYIGAEYQRRRSIRSTRGLNARVIRRLHAEGLGAVEIATRLKLRLDSVTDFIDRITPLPGRPALKKPRTRREQANLRPTAPAPLAPINWWQARPRPGRKYGDWSHPEFEWYKDASTDPPPAEPAPELDPAAAIAEADPVGNGWEEPPPAERWRGRNDVGPSGQPVMLDPVPPLPPPVSSPGPAPLSERWERPKGRRPPPEYLDPQ